MLQASATCGGNCTEFWTKGPNTWPMWASIARTWAKFWIPEQLLAQLSVSLFRHPWGSSSSQWVTLRGAWRPAFRHRSGDLAVSVPSLASPGPPASQPTKRIAVRRLSLGSHVSASSRSSAGPSVAEGSQAPGLASVTGDRWQAGMAVVMVVSVWVEPPEAQAGPALRLRAWRMQCALRPGGLGHYGVCCRAGAEALRACRSLAL